MVAVKKNNKDAFMVWAASVLPAKRCKWIEKNILRLEQFAIATKMISGSIFDITDISTLEVIYKSAGKNKVFQIKNRKLIKNINDDFNVYMRYCLQLPIQTEKKGEASVSIESDNLAADAPAETKEALNVVDFESIESMAFTKPISITFFGKELSIPSTWKDVYASVVAVLYKNYPDVFSSLSSFPGSTRLEFGKASDSGRMTSPRKIVEELYIETNFSATDICWRIRRLLNACDVSCSDVEIHYAKKGHDVPSDYRSSPYKSDRYDDIDLTQYREILKSKFPRGFRLNDSIDIKKFRRCWNELYNEENSLSNEVIWDYISQMTIAHGKMSYLPEMMIDEEAKAKLFNYIDETFASGKTAIYYEALYRMFRDELDNGRINNAEMLKTYLEYTTKNKYFLQKTYIAVDSKAKVDPVEEVRKFLKSHEMPMMKEDILKDLPHLDKDKVTSALSGNNSYEFVRNQKGEYFHADIIEFTDREIARIEQWISDSISQNEYIGGKELTSLIDRYLPEIHERYTFLTELGLRDTIAYKLRGKFSFKSKIISTYGEDLNMDKVFARFGKNYTPFNMEQLIALKDELGTTIYFDSLYRYAMRVSKNEFVSRDYADFDIPATDDVIEQFCTGDFISLKDVTLFGGFPSCGYAWNSYLLEYYVMYFSRKFKLLHTNFNMTSSVGAIVKKNTAIETFDDVIVRALAESNIALTTDDALNYLCESGLLARRSYSTIDNIVSRAKAYRAKKGE